jgi:putative membrane protein
MNQPPINSEPQKTLNNNDLALDRTELAKYRSRAAADRTLMAWIRTSLSLIGFGFGIPTIVKAIESTRLHPHLNPVRFSVIVGLAFIGTGMLGMVLGLREHRQLLKQIESDRYTYKTSHSAEIVAVALLIIGLVSFVGVIVKSLDF